MNDHHSSHSARRDRRRQQGFTLIELLIVVAIIGIIAAIAVPGYRATLVRAHISAVASDCRLLRDAFILYAQDNGQYPNADTEPKFDIHTFAPLTTNDYYNGRPFPKLAGQGADAYDSPDDRGTNQEFWIEMTLKIDPSIRFLVVDSDDAPLAGGTNLGGVFMFRDGVLTPIDQGHR